MKKTVIYYLIALMLVFTQSGCDSSEDVEPIIYDSHPFLRPYVDKVISEAKDRNIHLKHLNGVRFKLVQPLTVDRNNHYTTDSSKIFKRVDGLADYENKIVYIDTSRHKISLSVEELVMHEVGHISRIRTSHSKCLFELIAGPTPSDFQHSSVMNPGYFRLFSHADSLSYRSKYYYDELFNEDTEQPYWLSDSKYTENCYY